MPGPSVHGTVLAARPGQLELLPPLIFLLLLKFLAAYGLAVVSVMLLDTSLLAIVMITVWKVRALGTSRCCCDHSCCKLSC